MEIACAARDKSSVCAHGYFAKFHTSIYSIFPFLRAKFPIFIYLFLNLLFGFS